MTMRSEPTEQQKRNLARHTEEAGQVAARLLRRYQEMRGRDEAIEAPYTLISETSVAITSGDTPDSPVDPAPDEPACPDCENRRFILDSAGEMKPCPTCRVAQKRHAANLEKYSSALGRSKGQTFETFKPYTSDLLKCRLACIAFAGKPDGWLVIYGQPGNGKSHLCAAVYNELAAHSQDAIFTTMPDLVASLKSLFDKATAEDEGETYAGRLQAYQQAKILIVDDLGAEQQTAWTAGLLFELLDYRYRNNLPTMISTNYDPLDRDAFDARLVSRWNDQDFSVIVKNSAPDYRQSPRWHEQRRVA